MTKLILSLAFCSSFVTGGIAFYISQTSVNGADVIYEKQFMKCHEKYQSAYDVAEWQAFDKCTLIMQGKEVF